MALLRLLDRQGLLVGDLNHLQRYAVQEIIKSEFIEERKKESLRFKMQAAIAFPESARDILNDKEEDDEFDVQEIEEYDPENPGFSDQSMETMLEALEQFGFYVESEDR